MIIGEWFFRVSISEIPIGEACNDFSLCQDLIKQSKELGIRLPDESKIKALVATLTSIDIDEAMKGASLMTATVPGTSGVSESTKAVKDGSITEEVEEEEEEGDDLGLSSLFG